MSESFKQCCHIQKRYLPPHEALSRPDGKSVRDRSFLPLQQTQPIQWGTGKPRRSHGTLSSTTFITSLRVGGVSAKQQKTAEHFGTRDGLRRRRSVAAF